MKNLICLFAIFSFLLITECASAKQNNIILFIGDGMGPSVLGAARIYNKELYFDKMPHTAIIRTAPYNGPVTDSAASATAFATGKLAFNKAVGVGHKEQSSGVISKKNTSLAAIAKAKGMSVAVITDSTIVDATPAAFYAKTTDRGQDEAIMTQLFNSSIDLVIGGGQDTYDKVKDQNKKFQYISSSKEFFALNTVNKPHLVLLSRGTFPYYGTQKRTTDFPDLEKILRKTIELLSKNPKGYFIAIEGGLIDKALHVNETDSALQHVDELQRAVKMADQKTNDKDTLLVVTADHDTSGISINGYASNDTKIGDQLDRYGVKYSFLTYTTGPKGLVKMKKGVHTGVDIHLFAKGRKAHRFRGTLHHTDVYKKIKALLK